MSREKLRVKTMTYAAIIEVRGHGLSYGDSNCLNREHIKANSRKFETTPFIGISGSRHSARISKFADEVAERKGKHCLLKELH